MEAMPILILVLLTGLFSVGELGHALLGVLSRDIAQEIGYGDKACLTTSHNVDSGLCQHVKTESECIVITVNTTKAELPACEWNFNGLGTDYQLLAGPAFMACYTVAGVLWGIAADRMNRVILLGVATLAFSLSISGTAFASAYWHLVLCRMALAIGEAAVCPLAAGMIGDVLPQKRRALAMSVFNWGVYIGVGGAFAVGSYVNDTSMFSQRWRSPFLMSGVPGIILGVVLMLVVREPRNKKLESSSSSITKADGKEKQNVESTGSETEEKLCKRMSEDEVDGESVTLWRLMIRPAVVIFILAACIRHSAGFCWGYNSALYFQTYYPEHDVGWWIFGISIGGGILGSVAGGHISDLLIDRLGISARPLVLAGSQLLSTSFSAAVLYLSPPYAFIPLLIGYVASEMWFGVMYAILVEIFPERFRSTAIGIALFFINNWGGIFPILVEPLSKLTSYRTAIVMLFPGALLTSSVLFFVCWALLRKK